MLFLPHRTRLFPEARRSVKRRIEQKNKWFFMLINHLCIYVLFVDIFTRSFNDFISTNLPISVYLQAHPLFQPLRLLTLQVFASLPVYCTLPVYYFDWNLPASPVIPPSPSIWNLRVYNLFMSTLTALMKSSLKIKQKPV